MNANELCSTVFFRRWSDLLRMHYGASMAIWGRMLIIFCCYAIAIVVVLSQIQIAPHPDCVYTDYDPVTDRRTGKRP